MSFVSGCWLVCLCLYVYLWPVCGAELKEAQRKKKMMKERFKQEESIASAMVAWNNEILPNWESM